MRLVSGAQEWCNLEADGKASIQILRFKKEKKTFQYPRSLVMVFTCRCSTMYIHHAQRETFWLVGTDLLNLCPRRSYYFPYYCRLCYRYIVHRPSLRGPGLQQAMRLIALGNSPAPGLLMVQSELQKTSTLKGRFARTTSLRNCAQNH